MKLNRYKNISLGLILSCFLISCEDYLEVDTPDHRIVSETVFNDDNTALSAMNGIYNELFNSHFSMGWENSVTVLGALSADDLKHTIETDYSYSEFEHNEISPENIRNLSLWTSAYNIIYMTNALLEGIENSNQISESVHASLRGEAKFVRAFTYFYLVNLYGEVPNILTTDYRQNSLASQSDEASIYGQILADLTEASEVLEDDYRDGDRTRVNRFAALGLLARVNLYLENWDEAERLAGLVLDNSSQYELKQDVSETFLANSKEALWQLSPVGNRTTYTYEGLMFLFHPLAPGLTKVRLSQNLIETYEPHDERFKHWIGYREDRDVFYAFKYKYRSRTEEIIEYSMVLRIAEQYLIRSEARARVGDVQGALADLDKIRERAGLNLISETSQVLDENQVIELIMEERRKEMFAEWGHRWLDLKRSGEAAAILGADNILFPIPEEERIKNPNLIQNTGY